MVKVATPLGTKAADENISRMLLKDGDGLSFPKPPKYFEVCTIQHVDNTDKLKVINLEMPGWPVAFNADGCSTNVSTDEKLLSQVGLLSLNMCCASHAADGSLKRMVNSKTMNVSEVSEFLPFSRKVMKHIKLSSNGMKKVYMITLCPTKMSYLLSACLQAVALLVPLRNVLVSLDLKKEQRVYFMSPKSMSIMHIPADLEPFFKKHLLKALDGDNGIIIDTFHINLEFVEKISNDVQFPKLSKFLNNI